MVPVAVCCAFALIENLPLCWQVQTSQQGQKRGFTTAAFPHNGIKFPALKIKVNAFYCMYLLIFALICIVYLLCL